MRLIREEKDFLRDAILLMLPMILQNFVTFSMSMADTFMVGVLGETALAAVTMANSPFYVMQLMIFGVQSGMSVLVAQYHGRGDQEAINRVMGIALFVSTTISGLLAVTAFCIPEQIMRVLTNNADLIAPGAAYTRYVGFSYFFAAISGVYIAVQRSTENPRLGAVLLTVSGALNIFLNWVLIYGKLGAPMLGCAGAAIATLISRAFEVTVLCVYARFSRRLPLMPRALLHPGRVIAKEGADGLLVPRPREHADRLLGRAELLRDVGDAGDEGEGGGERPRGGALEAEREQVGERGEALLARDVEDARPEERCGDARQRRAQVDSEEDEPVALREADAAVVRPRRGVDAEREGEDERVPRDGAGDPRALRGERERGEHAEPGHGGEQEDAHVDHGGSSRSARGISPRTASPGAAPPRSGVARSTSARSERVASAANTISAIHTAKTAATASRPRAQSRRAGDTRRTVPRSMSTSARSAAPTFAPCPPPMTGGYPGPKRLNTRGRMTRRAMT